MALIGYCRNRHGLTAEEQRQKMLSFGLEERHIYVEPHPPKRNEPPQWHWCQMGLRNGDALVVEGLHALGGDKIEVLLALEGMEAMDVDLVSIGDKLDTRDGGRFPFAGFAKALRRLDTHLRRAGKRGTGVLTHNARVKAGKVNAQGRPKLPIPPEAVAAWQDVENYPFASMVAEAFGVSQATLSRRLGKRPALGMK